MLTFERGRSGLSHLRQSSCYPMASLPYVPKNFLVTNPAFETSYKEDKFMSENGLKKRKTWMGYSVAALQKKVGESVYINWPASVRRNWKAPYVNHIVDAQITELYVYRPPFFFTLYIHIMHQCARFAMGIFPKGSARGRGRGSGRRRGRSRGRGRGVARERGGASGPGGGTGRGRGRYVARDRVREIGGHDGDGFDGHGDIGDGFDGNGHIDTGDNDDDQFNDELSKLKQSVNDKYGMNILSDEVVSEWRKQMIDLDVLKTMVLNDDPYLSSSGLLRGGYYKLKIFFGEDEDKQSSNRIDNTSNSIPVSSIVIEYFRKFFVYIINTKLTNGCEPDTRMMTGEMNSLVQSHKFKKAKAEVGKVYPTLMRVIDQLVNIGLIEIRCIKSKSSGKGGDKYGIQRIQLKDAQSIFESVTDSKKYEWEELIKKYNIKEECKNLALSLGRNDLIRFIQNIN